MAETFKDWLARQPLEEDPREKERQTRAALADPLARPPDEEGRVRMLARQAQIPEAEARIDPVGAERAARVREAEERLKSSPRVAAWLGSPRNMEVARDDVDALAELERAARPFIDAAGVATGVSGLLRMAPGRVGQAAKESQARGFEVPRRVGHTWRALDYDTERFGLMASDAEKASGLRRAGTVTAQTFLDSLRRRADEERSQGLARGVPEDLVGLVHSVFGGIGAGVASVAETPDATFDAYIPKFSDAEWRADPVGVRAKRASGYLQALANLPGDLLQAGPRGLFEYTMRQEAGSALEQYRQVRDVNGRPIPEEIQAKAALAVGGFNGVVEFASEGAFLAAEKVAKKLGFGVGERAVTKAVQYYALSQIAKKYGIKIGATAFGEGVVEEGTQGLATQMGEEAAKSSSGQDFAPTDWGEVWKSIAYQAALGSLAGGAFGGIAATPELISDLQSHQRAQQNAATIQRLSSAAAKSRLLKRDPEAFADAARAIAPEESIVLIDADAFAQIAQDKGMAPAELAQTLGVKTDDLDAAMNGNGMLQMPVADYLAKFASNDVGAALTSHITFDPDTPTLAQAEKEQAIAEKVAADIAKEAQAEVKQQVAADPAESPDAPYRDIYRATLDRLNAISSEPGGRTRADNEKNALLFTQGIATLAKRAGIDPREAFRRFAPTVETEAYPQARNPRIERGLETLDAKSWIALPHRDLALAAGPEGDVVHFTAKRATTVGGVTVKKGEVGVVHQDGRVEAMAPEAFAAAYQPQAAPAQAHAETMQAWRTAAGGPPTTASPITIEEIKHGFRATDSRSGRVTETYSSAGGITTRTKQEGAEWGRDALVLNEEGAWVSVNSIVLMDGTDSSRKPWRGSSRATKAALDVLRKLEDESLSRDMRDKLNDALLDIVFYGDRKLDEVEALVAETSQEPAGTETLEQAQKAGYGGNDTGEAEEWLRAKAKGLDMSTEARMARAREMGLNPPVSDERAANVVGVSADAQGDFLEGQTGGVKRAREVGVPSLGDLTRIWNSVGLGNPPSTLEGFQDVVRQSPELLSDFAESLAALKKGSSGVDIVAHRVVLARVLPVLQDFQVLDAIVEAIPVDVMNVFFGEQGAPKSLFGNEAMLFDLFAVNGDVNVTAAISAAAPAMRVMARMAAKKVGSPSYVAALSQDLFFAYGASHTNWQSQSPSVLEPKAYSIYSQGAFDPDYADSANILAQPAPETFNQETTAPALAQAEQLAAAVREAAACAAREGVEGALVGALAPIMAGNALAAAAAVPLGIVGVPALVEAGKGPPDEEQQRRRLEALRAHWREVLPQSPFPADIAPDMGNAVTLSEAALAAANEPAPQPMGAADTGAQPMNSKGLPLPEPASAPEPEQ